MIKLTEVSLAVQTYDEVDFSLKNTITNLLSIKQQNPFQKQEIKVLNSLNLEVKSREKLGLLGNNGAGKTTLLRIISKILPPTSGKVEVNGKVRCLIQPMSGIIEQATGTENIVLKGFEFGLSKDEIKTELNKVKKFVELGEYIDRPVFTYSNGMKTRLAVGVQMLGAFEVLIIDEGIGATDKNFRPRIKELFDELISNAKCMIMASHDIGLLSSNTNRIVRLVDGKISD